jgi:hypothetical protein
VAVFLGQALVLTFEARVLGERDIVGRVSGAGTELVACEVGLLGELAVGGATLVCDLRPRFILFILLFLIEGSESLCDLSWPHYPLSATRNLCE